MTHIDAIVVGAAADQFNVLTIEQARALGLTDRMRQQRVRDGRLLAMGRRTLALPGEASWPTRLAAATLEAGPAAVVSHMSAAAWWGLAGINPGAIEITVPLRCNPRAVCGVVHRKRLEPVDIDRTQALAMTSPSRTLLDVAIRLTLRQLECCVDGACRDGLTSASYLRQRLTEWRRRGRPGGLRLGAVLAGTGDGRPLGSWLEREALKVISDAGLPRPATQKEVQVDGSRFFIDLFYAEANLAVELAGHGTHATRQELADDAERAALITSLGYQVITFTYDQVTKRPDYVVATLRRFLGL